MAETADTRPPGAVTRGERPYHHGSLRTALLAQAERTLRERGVQELSLRELARAVGVSHGARPSRVRAPGSGAAGGP